MKPVFVVFDGPPNHDSGRFVEVETADGKSVVNADFPWTEHGDYWHLGPFFTANQLRAAQVAILRAVGAEYGETKKYPGPCFRMADELEKQT